MKVEETTGVITRTFTVTLSSKELETLREELFAASDAFNGNAAKQIPALWEFIEELTYKKFNF